MCQCTTILPTRLSIIFQTIASKLFVRYKSRRCRKSWNPHPSSLALQQRRIWRTWPLIRGRSYLKDNLRSTFVVWQDLCDWLNYKITRRIEWSSFFTRENYWVWVHHPSIHVRRHLLPLPHAIVVLPSQMCLARLIYVETHFEVKSSHRNKIQTTYNWYENFAIQQEGTCVCNNSISPSIST